jgi:nitronate monooxygenase
MDRISGNRGPQASAVRRALAGRVVIQAPMAGGGTTPELVAAVSDAGGLGFLAAGYQSADQARGQIRAVRGMTGAPFGLNLFVPGPDLADPEQLAAYRARLEPAARASGASLGDPVWEDDDWAAKLDLLEREPVAVVSFTFGCPPEPVLARLRELGSLTVVTVTTRAEAVAAQATGADALCVQGAEAGAHRGSFTADAPVDGALGLLSLLAEVAGATKLPLIAAGGLMHGAEIASVLATGAVAAQLGTAFLPCPESGAHRLHKAALTDPAYTRTEFTRAFTGRPARGLVNRFMIENSAAAPVGYPNVHHLTRPLRQASAAAGDTGGMALWAGLNHRLVRPMPAGDLVRMLMKEAG